MSWLRKSISRGQRERPRSFVRSEVKARGWWNSRHVRFAFKGAIARVRRGVCCYVRYLVYVTLVAGSRQIGQHPAPRASILLLIHGAQLVMLFLVLVSFFDWCIVLELLSVNY